MNHEFPADTGGDTLTLPAEPAESNPFATNGPGSSVVERAPYLDWQQVDFAQPVPPEEYRPPILQPVQPEAYVPQFPPRFAEPVPSLPALPGEARPKVEIAFPVAPISDEMEGTHQYLSENQTPLRPLTSGEIEAKRNGVAPTTEELAYINEERARGIHHG